MRITNNNISKLKPNEIFVFGSNTAGIHGAGAARLAYQNFGARMGVGFGLENNTFAIPTKDSNIKTMNISEIKPYVDLFIEYAKTKRNLIFLVTEIGCGLAGYQPKDIAPLFKEAMYVENIFLPQRFWDVLNQ